MAEKYDEERKKHARTVAELREFLKDIDGETPVQTPFGEHGITATLFYVKHFPGGWRSQVVEIDDGDET